MTSSGLRGIHYSQQSVKAGEFVFNRGEDTLPFVCDEFMLVGDGVGGDGAFAHTKMNPAMWDKQARRELFGVTEEDEQLSAYFDGLFVEMDRENEDGKKPKRYTVHPERELHSGYFGSRLASFSFVSLLRHEERFAPQKLFELLDAAAEEEARAKCRETYAAELCESLLVKMRDLAKVGGFELESSRNAAKLLPTTLAAALYRDVGDETQVICIWAGDSRIVAQLSDGCVQLTADDEKDEGMTNLISLNTKVHLNIREFRFKRPFALLAVSDGTFDDMLSHLCFEAVVVLDALNCDTQEAMQDTWKHIFSVVSKDDSATVAYFCFGMEDMEACKKFAAPRIGQVEKYVEQLPDLFDVDYRIELQHVNRAAKKQLAAFGPEIAADPNVLESYLEEEKQSPSPMLMSALKTIEDEKHKLDAQEDEIFEQARKYIEKEWLALRPQSDDKRMNEIAGEIGRIRTDKDACRIKYKQKLDLLKNSLGQLTEKWTSLMDMDAAAVDGGSIESPLAGENAELLKQLIHSFQEITSDMKDYCKGWDEVRSFEKCSRKEEDLNEQLLEKEAEQIENAARQVLTSDEIDASDELPDEVQQYRQALCEIEEKRAAVEAGKQEALRQAAQKRAESDLGNVTETLLNGEGLLERLSADLREKIEAVLNEFKAKRETLKAKAEIQSKINDENDAHYLELIQED